MQHLLDTWYMFGWSSELPADSAGALLHRTIAGQPILAYRLASGASAAA